MRFILFLYFFYTFFILWEGLGVAQDTFWRSPARALDPAPAEAPGPSPITSPGAARAPDPPPAPGPCTQEAQKRALGVPPVLPEYKKV